MEDGNMMIGRNHDTLLRQNQYLEPGHSHSSALVNSHNFELEGFDHQNLDVDVEIASLELGLGQTDDCDLIPSQTNEHDLVQYGVDVHDFKENGIDFYGDNKANLNKSHNFRENDADLYGDDKADLNQSLTNVNGNSFTNPNHGIDSSENYELSLEYPDTNGNQGLSVAPISMVDFQLSTVVSDPHPSILQCPTPELTVGKEFPDVHSCRRAVRDAAIAYHFEMQTIKSDKTRFTAKCASEGCPWRIHAAKLAGVPTFTIRTVHEKHTCGRITHPGHLQASVQWVADSMEQRLKENPDCTPKEILEHIYRVHGIPLSYKQAWRAKERFVATVRGSFEEEYRLLPQYCHQVRKMNPGSIALIYGSAVDNCFERLFISFQASIYGFLNACRPLIGLGKTPLKSKYLGTLLFATGFDGDGATFPLAFGVVDNENVDNWMWFLSELHNLLESNAENMPKLSILSDRQNGVLDGVEVNFPTAFHGFCMQYLIDSFREQFNNAILVNLMWEAANVLTVQQFEQKILMIDEISEEASYWVRSIDPRLWASAYFEGTRFGQLTANLVESLNTLIQEASGFPIIQMMEFIRRRLMTLFNDRRETSLQWTSTLVPSAHSQVSEAIESACACQVLKANDAEFEVISDEGTHMVNICTRKCSCHGWQLRGLPCVHAVAALVSCRQNVFRFAESCFTVAHYRKAYSETIHPIPDKTLWGSTCEGSQISDYNDDEIINPPKSLVLPPGKPRKKRKHAEHSGCLKRTVRCSRCHQTGHFRTTCTVPM
ncbi:uncharacterized protein [Euphorbia lathyris]|uniref:uncharacterized protein n=1 Tax=Euphorbia lathyris TaxID=212925 RepID=UPI003313192C